jgi:ubiquinone biosynthesis protein
MRLGNRLTDESGEEDVRGPIRRMLSDKYVHAKRVGEILAALSRFGFGRVWDSASLLKDLQLDSRERKELAQMRVPIRLRLFFESLGPTYVKLGQMLSTRPDLIPEEYAEELANLRDDVPPVPFEKIQETVECELGAKLADLFSSFDERPLAVASIGQVHRAVVKGTGEKVAVKVQRPDVAEIVKADMEILKDLVRVLKSSFRSIPNFDPEAVLDEFGRMIQREIDYTIEARNIRRFTENFKDMKEVCFPTVHWQLKLDLSRLTEVLGKAYIKMIFADGFFHADPHQGNIFILKDGRVCFLDFGAIGYLDDDTRDRVSLFYMSLIKQDVGRAAGLLVEMSGAARKNVDLRLLEWDLRDYIDYTLLRREKVKMAAGMNRRIATISMKHGVMLPSSFVLLERALAEVEGVCRTLDPDFDIVELAQKNLMLMLEARYRPKLDPLQAVETARSYRVLVRELPGRVDRLLKKLETDDFTVKVDTSLFDDLKHNIRRMGLIMAVTVIAASLIIYMGWEGQSLNLQLVHVTVGVSAIVFAWLVAVFAINRRG